MEGPQTEHTSFKRWMIPRFLRGCLITLKSFCLENDKLEATCYLHLLRGAVDFIYLVMPLMSSSLRTNWNQCFCLRSNPECVPVPSLVVGLGKPPTAVTACVKTLLHLPQVPEPDGERRPICGRCLQPVRVSARWERYGAQGRAHRPARLLSQRQCRTKPVFTSAGSGLLHTGMDCSSSGYIIFNGFTGLMFVSVTAPLSLNTAVSLN